MEPTSSVKKPVARERLLVARGHLLAVRERLPVAREHLVVQGHLLTGQEHLFNLVAIAHPNGKQSKLPTRNMRYADWMYPSYHMLTKFTEFRLTATTGARGSGS